MEKAKIASEALPSKTLTVRAFLMQIDVILTCMLVVVHKESMGQLAAPILQSGSITLAFHLMDL